MAERKKVRKETEEVKKKAPPRARKKKPVEEIKPIEAPVPEAGKVKPAVPAGPKYFGTGRRKEAVAEVCLTAGAGKIVLNNRLLSEYFCGRKLLEFQINRPFAVTQTAGRYDVFADVYGGGVPGQAGAVSLGIARALVELNPDFKVLLKREGLLTRDPRMKERKKYGLKRARRAFQYTKR